MSIQRGARTAETVGREPRPGGSGNLGWSAFVAAFGVGTAAAAGIGLGYAPTLGLKLTIIGFAVFFCVVLFGWAYAQYRYVRPPKAKGVELSSDRKVIRRGEEVELRLQLTELLPPDDKIEVGLVCVEYYSHMNLDGARLTLEFVAYEDWATVDTTRQLQTKRFRVPPDAPFSYRGSTLSFVWSAVARKPGRLLYDRAVEEQIAVTP